MRILLCVILFLSVAWIGVQQAASCNRKQMLLLTTADSLAVLQSEICVQRAPLPAALFRTAEVFEQTKPFYQLLLQGMESELPFSVCWRSVVMQMPLLTRESRHALLALGEQIGRYDLQAQESAFDVCISTIRYDAEKASCKSKENMKLSVGIGAICGLLLAIVCF